MKSTLRHFVAFLTGTALVAILVFLYKVICVGEVKSEAHLSLGSPTLSVYLVPAYLVPPLLAAAVLSWACGAFVLALLHERRGRGFTPFLTRSSVSEVARWLQVLVAAGGLVGLWLGRGQHYRVFESEHREGHFWTPFSLTIDLTVAGFLVCCVAVGVMEALAWRRRASLEGSGTARPLPRTAIGLSTLLAAGQVLVGALGFAFWAWLYRVFHPLDRDWPLVEAHMASELHRYVVGMPLAAKALLGLNLLITASALGWCVWAFVVLLAWWRRGHNNSPMLLHARQMVARLAGALFALQIVLFFVVPCDRSGRLGLIVRDVLSVFPLSLEIDVWAVLLGLSAIALTLWSVGGTVVESLVRLLKRRDEQGNAEASA